jgi:putative ABC transport system substrate-binding protein
LSSLNRPGGNATGVLNYDREIVRKRIELLRELVDGPPRDPPQKPPTKIAYLINADDTNLGPGARKQIDDELATAGRLAQLVLDSRSEEAIRASFTKAADQNIGAMLVGSDPFFTNRRDLLVALAAEKKLPAGYQQREFAEVGGLMSYGPSGPESLRQAGNYAGRILKGADPAEMPVLTPTKFELVINLKTARTLGLTVPGTLLVSADEIIK